MSDMRSMDFQMGGYGINSQISGKGPGSSSSVCDETFFKLAPVCGASVNTHKEMEKEIVFLI